MVTVLFENNDFILRSTGHDFDFVGTIETKTEEPLTFFFSEKLVELTNPETGESYDEWEPDETKTELLGVHQGLKEYDSDASEDGDDEIKNTATMYLIGGLNVESVNWFRTRDDKVTGFLSDPTQRGMFLALVKSYCPEKLSEIPWA